MDVEISSTRNLKPHESLWFEDGNIVLATDVHLYCVHRGVLARNSTVFKDMLELSNVGKTSNPEAESITNGDTWEGKPIVRMVGDSDEDVYHILMAIYDVKFYSAHKPSTLPIILSLMRMSTKYILSDIQDEVTRHLQRIYPSDLESMEKRAVEDLFIDHTKEARDFDFQLLAVAQQCDMKTILPVLYFDCAASSVDLILEASEAPYLRRQVLTRIFHGYIQLADYAREYGFIAFSPLEKCTPSCSSARSALFADYMVDSSPFTVCQLLQKSGLEDDKELRASVCEDCTKALSKMSEAYRQVIWNSIPRIFGLGIWEDVKRE